MENTTTPATKTVYIGKGRYGTNHKGHAIATHTPAQRPTPGQGAYVYTVTITDLDGTETTLPEPIEAAHAEAAAVAEWERRNTPAEPEPLEIGWGVRVEITGGPDMNHGTTGTIVNRYSIRHGHKMNDILTDWGTMKNYYADDQLKAIAPAPAEITATVKRIPAPSGNRDNDYFQPVCVCGWEGASYSNRTIEGRQAAEKHAADHHHAPGAKVYIGTLGKWNNHK